MSGFHVRAASWLEEQRRLMHVRDEVFVLEQGVSRELERDEYDHAAFHVLAEDDHGLTIGAGRLRDDGRIGRMCVLKDYRGTGVGASILEALVAEAKRRGLDEVTLHAQVHAQQFYEKFGCMPTGDLFEEAGIMHRLMTLPLNGQD